MSIAISPIHCGQTRRFTIYECIIYSLFKFKDKRVTSYFDVKSKANFHASSQGVTAPGCCWIMNNKQIFAEKCWIVTVIKTNKQKAVLDCYNWLNIAKINISKQNYIKQ